MHPFTRRILLLASASTLLLPRLAFATPTIAQTHVQAAIDAIMGIVNSGKPTTQIIADLTQAIPRYADASTIARSALGPPARTTSVQDLQAFIQGFSNYLGRKYSRRFEDLAGGSITISEVRTHDQGRFFVHSRLVTQTRNSSLIWHVLVRDNRAILYDLSFEGLSMLTHERGEIGAMLDAERGNIPALTQKLLNYR